jgi:hypothetical protein
LRAPQKLALLTRGVLIGEMLVLVATLIALVWTSHLGGTLVYEQGAGYLRTPNESCADDSGLGLKGGDAPDHTEKDDDDSI